MPLFPFNFNQRRPPHPASKGSENGQVGVPFRLGVIALPATGGLMELCKIGFYFFEFDLGLEEWQVPERMDADERDICLYLKGWPGQFVSVAEITRRASGKRRGRQEPNWALPALSRLVEQGIVEADSTGHYRLIRRSKKETKKRWVSPQIEKILQKSGKSFEGVFDVGDDDNLPEHLK